jgi:hypothetical protein
LAIFLANPLQFHTRGYWACFFQGFNFDDLVKSQKVAFSVIPAKAGIQLFQVVLDPGFRRGDDPRDFLRDHQL